MLVAKEDIAVVHYKIMLDDSTKDYVRICCVGNEAVLMRKEEFDKRDIICFTPELHWLWNIPQSTLEDNFIDDSNGFILVDLRENKK